MPHCRLKDATKLTHQRRVIVRLTSIIVSRLGSGARIVLQVGTPLLDSLRPVHRLMQSHHHIPHLLSPLARLAGILVDVTDSSFLVLVLLLLRRAVRQERDFLLAPGPSRAPSHVHTTYLSRSAYCTSATARADRRGRWLAISRPVVNPKAKGRGRGGALARPAAGPPSALSRLGERQRAGRCDGGTGRGGEACQDQGRRRGAPAAQARPGRSFWVGAAVLRLLRMRRRAGRRRAAARARSRPAHVCAHDVCSTAKQYFGRHWRHPAFPRLEGRLRPRVPGERREALQGPAQPVHSQAQAVLVAPLDVLPVPAVGGGLAGEESQFWNSGIQITSLEHMLASLSLFVSCLLVLARLRRDPLLPCLGLCSRLRRDVSIDS